MTENAMAAKTPQKSLPKDDKSLFKAAVNWLFSLFFVAAVNLIDKQTLLACCGW